MVGLSKIVTVLVTVMAVLCLAGFASPAFAQAFGGKGIPGTSNLGANMAKGIPQAANLGKSVPQANIPMGKGIPQAANMAANANLGLGKGMGKGGYGGDMGGFARTDTSALAGAGGGAPGGY
jgi:hypothetical protein